MKTLMQRFVRDDAGQDLIEYGLLIGLITAAIVLLIGPIGDIVLAYYQDLKDNLDAA
jgi:Flp pilus assembly pilin Flp